ncbi:hypothetical protein HPB48_004638 [Haemaphysalis longicornis]|uniref:Brinker DNA-binding domain-containing protein n=1 Tax=Haemaphysalis longicornis TaxID=44386 RepID=A0A9J6G0T9_HAELO|nr:hypothetical protein HPB48_004638 [Haemaphysalis longicornis]
MSRRMSYTTDFKQRVILFAENSNNWAAQRVLGVNEKLIRGWRKRQDELFACSGLPRAFRGPTIWRHDALEKELRLHVGEERVRKDSKCSAKIFRPKLGSWCCEAGLAVQPSKPVGGGGGSRNSYGAMDCGACGASSDDDAACGSDQ